MAPAYAAGAGAGAVAALAAPVALPAAAIGTAAFGLTALGSYIADNISRQKEEQDKAGKKYEDINRLTAGVAGAGQTALDIVGFKFFKPLGRLVGIEGKEAAEKSAMEIVNAATKPGAYKRAVARGTAQGIAFEIPQEVTQQVLERWQAGLPLNPFNDPNAAKEYLEAAGGALLLGGPMGAYSQAANTFKARRTPEGQTILKGVTEGSPLDTLLKEEENVGQPINPPSGTSTGLAGQPSTNVAPPGGTEGTETTRVVPPREDVTTLDVRKNGQPPAISTVRQLALDEQKKAGWNLDWPFIPADLGNADFRQSIANDPSITAEVKNQIFEAGKKLGVVPKNEKIEQGTTVSGTQTSQTQQTTPQGQTTPAINPKPIEEFADSYKYLLGVLDEIDQKFEAQGELTDGQTYMMHKTLKDLHQLVDEQDLDKVTATQLKNVSTGAETVKRLQPRAMQGKLFTGGKEEKVGTEEPESLASVFGKTTDERAQERAKELSAEIEARNAPKTTRIKEKFTPQIDLVDRLANEKSREKKRFAEDEAERLRGLIEEKQRQRKAKAEEFGAITDEDLDLSDLDTELEEKQPMQEAEKAPLAVAPAETTEHIAETEEGTAIKNFFGNIKSGAGTEDEKTKHNALKNVIINNALSYDISKPGEKTSSGLQQVLKFLADRVGGRDQLNKLMASLKDATLVGQSRLFKGYFLPDLTTRRGLQEFNTDLQIQMDSMQSKGEGPKIPRRNIPSKVTGEHRGILPYEEKIIHILNKSVAPGALPEGTPRSPSIYHTESKHFIQDPTVRAAVRFLNDHIHQNPTREMVAAYAYLNNKSRGEESPLGNALKDLAFDIAHFEDNPDFYGANSTFQNEGGEYALQFQKWIEENLSKDTVETLNKLIAEQRSNIVENQKHANAVTKHNIDLKLFKAENKIKRAEQSSGKKLPRAPKREAMKEAETETNEQEEIAEPKVSRKNLPRVREVSQVHPAIHRLLEAGKVQEALKLIADARGNNYYGELAKRLLDAGITATSRIVDVNVVESLSGDPQVKATLNNQINGLVDAVVAYTPKSEHDVLVSYLTSDNLTEIRSALGRLNSLLRNANEAQKEILRETQALLNKEFSWIGKYDPNADEIVLRGSSAGITDHLFLHESLHAAAIGLLDNPDQLKGVQREGYDKLLELYNHSKGMLSLQGMNEGNIYGLQDLHEFVSEAMTNPEFQALLRALRYKAAPFSLWTSFTNAVSKLFGVKPGTESNVMVEVMRATDALLIGGVTGKEGMSTSEPKAMKIGRRITALPAGVSNQPGMFKQLMSSENWNAETFSRFFSSAKASVRPFLLGALTMRQIADLVGKRIPQVDAFIRVTEAFLARKNNILGISGDISRRWERMQSAKPEISKLLANVMHEATIVQVDPDKATAIERNANQKLMENWRALQKHPEAIGIYRSVRKFYEDRISEYKQLMDKRINMMAQFGASEKTITDLRNEFEQQKMKGPYFPLMRHGRFYYQVGTGPTREYYMFETEGQKEAHMKERLSEDPNIVITAEGSTYAEQMSHHAKESTFLKNALAAIDKANFTGATSINQKQELKDSLYQTFLANQPDRSFRNQFIHRKNIAGYSEDALRNFAASSFHMAYQLSRFEYAPEMFAQVHGAKAQIKKRYDVNKGREIKVSRENTELTDYITEIDKRLSSMLNPTDVGTIPSLLSNIGFIWYLTAPASAVVNVVGGMMVGLPTLVGQYVKANPNMSYATATLKALGDMKTVTGQILGTGFGIERGERLRDNHVLFPSLDRSSKLSDIDRAAYNKFVADGIIDITATYDQSGLAAAPTDQYFGVKQRTMQALTALFHNTERFNREVMAMSSFRAAMEKRKGYSDQEKAFNESIADAKDTTTRSMFDYSSPNKPRYFQHPTARVILQFKQFPQQMTFFLFHNFINMFRGASPEVKREATARFVGTMGMAAIFSGGTGLWGFSTVAMIANAVMNGLGDDDDEIEPFDFELEFVNWAVETFGQNVGTLLTRGLGNAAGIDLASRVKLDDMWFRDNRKNEDEVEWLQGKLIDALGPTVGLGINVAQAVKLFNEGHGDRALETVMPAFIKNPMVAARYANEGANTLRGDPLMEEISPFYLLMQSLGIRSAELAERQFYNIVTKGQEQTILAKRQNLLNLYAISFMSNDNESFDKAMDKIDTFNSNYPDVSIPLKSLNDSIKERMKKSEQSEHGLFIDKRLRGLLGDNDYLD